MKTLARILLVAGLALALDGCGHAARVPPAAVGPTGMNPPAYPTLLKHALSGVTSIEIRGAAGITTMVKRPTTVREIVSWFAALPHPPRQSVSDPHASDWCSGYDALREVWGTWRETPVF